MLNLIKEIKKHILQVTIGIIILIFIIVQFAKINDWLFTQGPDQLRIFFDNLGLLAIPIFILIYALANMLLAPSIPFIFIAGLVYGIQGGLAISLLAELISATLNFIIGKQIKKRWFINKSNNKKAKFLSSYINKHGFWLIFVLRYLGFYFDIVSFAAGMTKIAYKKYIAATFLGFIPYILIYVYAGNQLMDIKSSDFVYSILTFKLILFGVFLIVYVIHRYIMKSKIYNQKITKSLTKPSSL
tara:strand:+ start:171 stop:899 length:729 start_codon:yes stop_codon:yes gene_type:complete